MKKSVSELLGEMTSAELNEWITKIDSDPIDSEALDRIAALAAKKAGLQDGAPVPRAPRRFDRRVLLIAALAVILAAALVGCYVADVIEYNRAVEFFDLNNLSTEGLNRAEIKRVYRDITTESLRYDKSLEVLAQNSTPTDTAAQPKSVEGVDITILNGTNSVNSLPHDTVYDLSSGRYYIMAVDNSGGALSARNAAPSEGLYYLLDWEEGDESLWYRNTSVEKYLDGESLWRAELSHAFYPQRCLDAGDVIYVYGYNGISSETYDRIAALDSATGEVLWEKALGSSFSGISAVLTPQGEIALFSRAENPDDFRLIFRVLDRGGKVTAEREYDLPSGMTSIGDAIAIDDGWLIRTWGIGDWEESDSRVRLRRFCLMKLSADGAPVQTIRYGDESYSYDICDMTEHDGRIFVSATARPADSHLYREGDTGTPNGADALSAFSDEWRDRAREEFSAVLFVIDPDSGEPAQFYTVGGAFGGRLGTDADGRLTWSAERILTCGYSPATSAFSIFGNTRRYLYTLDSAANTLSQERTDQIGSFREH